MLCKNISKSVLAIEKKPEKQHQELLSRPSTENRWKTPWRHQRSKSESSVCSFQDHLGNHHGDKKSGKSVLSRPSTKCAKNEPKSGSYKAIEPQNMHKKGSFKTIEDGSKNKTLLSRPLQIGLTTLTPNTWSLLMRQLKSFQIPRPGRRHNQPHNSCPMVHLPQDHNSTPSMWSRDQ